MAGGLGVERDDFDVSYGLGEKQGSSPSFHDAFLTKQAQNRPLQVVLHDVFFPTRTCQKRKE